ncbi:MAG: hypothetical protein OXH70_00015 [Acidobacteria bacterium]|nr:hypothetical protein [Acidobacteriota bacterium]
MSQVASRIGVPNLKLTERSQDRCASQALKEQRGVQARQVEQIRRALEEAVAAAKSEFVEHDRVAAWLESWGSENEQDPPRAPGEASVARPSRMNRTR